MTMTQTPALDELAERMGIEPEFHNVRGELVCASADTKRRLLAALGTPAPDEPAARMALDRLRREEWTSALPPWRFSTRLQPL
jgi:4-alpha-glucanotransferase